MCGSEAVSKFVEVEPVAEAEGAGPFGWGGVGVLCVLASRPGRVKNWGYGRLLLLFAGAVVLGWVSCLAGRV